MHSSKTISISEISSNGPNSQKSKNQNQNQDSICNSSSSHNSSYCKTDNNNSNNNSNYNNSSISSDIQQDVQSTQTSSPRQSRVLIGGGSFGGLFLALFLERLGIPYYLIDCGAKGQHFGAALALGPSILPIFEQLGLANLLASISMPCSNVDLYNHRLKKLGAISMKDKSEKSDYEYLVCSRSGLYELLVARLDTANVIIGKKIISFEDNESGINLYCSDNTMYSGDILVGADGVHSKVRESLYSTLVRQKKKNMVTRMDREPMKPGYVLVSGVTSSQSSEKYHCLKDPFVHFCSVVGQRGRGWSVINIPEDQICWSLWVRLDSATALKLRNSSDLEGTPEDSESIEEWFKDIPCPYGGSMGELIDSTAEDSKSRVYIEERLFNTWYYGRTVLLGDACHSMLPWSGQGLVTDIHDAVVLANCLFDLEDLSPKNISNAFKGYCQQRYPHARTQYIKSQSTAKLICGQSIWHRLSRYAILNWTSQPYVQKQSKVSSAYRPQASFLTRSVYQEEESHSTPNEKQLSMDDISRRVAAVWGNAGSPR